MKINQAKKLRKILDEFALQEFVKFLEGFEYKALDKIVRYSGIPSTGKSQKRLINSIINAGLTKQQIWRIHSEIISKNKKG